MKEEEERGKDNRYRQ